MKKKKKKVQVVEAEKRRYLIGKNGSEHALSMKLAWMHSLVLMSVCMHCLDGSYQKSLRNGSFVWHLKVFLNGQF